MQEATRPSERRNPSQELLLLDWRGDVYSDTNEMVESDKLHLIKAIAYAYGPFLVCAH
jgi:hypothetical protein